MHDKLFNNRTQKYGLVRIYEIINFPDSLLNSIFSTSLAYRANLDNCKSFILLKRDEFNINVEFVLKQSILNLKVDINDIIKQENNFSFDHFNAIVELHDKIIDDEIYNIFGGLNG